MEQYRTALEISNRWKVTAKTVQKLCKSGKIEGAIKKAGIWFIPEDAAIPLRNAKSCSGHFKFVGTKKKIFDSAIELFMLRGYEYVSIKDIADVVGIMQSAIYNHFSSKQKILDTIYDYYVKYFNMNQKPVEYLKSILHNGTKTEFCEALMFTFNSEDEEKQKRMFMISKIIYMRFYQDERANDIFLRIMNKEIEEFDKAILDYGISIGAIEEFDTETYVKFIIGQRHFMGMKAFADPNYKPALLSEEIKITKMSMDMLPYIEVKDR